MTDSPHVCIVDDWPTRSYSESSDSVQYVAEMSCYQKDLHIPLPPPPGRRDSRLVWWSCRRQAGFTTPFMEAREIMMGRKGWAGRSIIQFLIRRIEQFLNSPIQFIDFIELINSIRNLRIEAICDQYAGRSSIKFRITLVVLYVLLFYLKSMHQLLTPIQNCQWIKVYLILLCNAGHPNALTSFNLQAAARSQSLNKVLIILMRYIPELNMITAWGCSSNLRRVTSNHDTYKTRPQRIH